MDHYFEGQNPSQIKVGAKKMKSKKRMNGSRKNPLAGVPLANLSYFIKRKNKQMAEYAEVIPKQGKNRRERIFATKVKHFKSNAQIQRDLSQWNYKSKEKLFKLQDIIELLSAYKYWP